MNATSPRVGLSPVRLLGIYMAVVTAAATVAIVIVFLSASQVDSQARRSAKHADAGVTAASIQAALAEPTLQLSNGYLAFFGTPFFAALPPEQQGAARNDVRATLLGQPFEPTSNARMPMSEKDLIALHDKLESANLKIDALLSGSQAEFGLDGVAGRRAALNAAFGTYLVDPSLANYNSLFRALVLLRTELNMSTNLISQELRAGQDELERNISFGRFAMAGSLIGLVLITSVATVSIGRLLHVLFRQAKEEKRELEQATDSLTYRNQQLTALYNVFTEITETLSLRYVIKATLREALKVMNAHMVVLRLLRGEELVLAGAINDAGKEFDELAPVPLGEGPTGRAARRGKPVYIREGAQDLLGPGPSPVRTESGIIAPLIVGAKVVGTIACWSRDKNAFTEEDQRVLEMMAGQVATAVVAADTTDLNDHRARHDPLTGLPNRVQLADDIYRELGIMAAQDRQAVVAMADIDHFKRFNDDFGHRVGDVTLQKVASVLRTAVRGGDRVYRYGGEEFVLVFVDAGASEAVALADRVRAAVEHTPLSGANLEPVGPVTISIGLALLPEHATDFASLIEMADSAMYQAKDQGRNRVVLWHEAAKPASLVA